MPTRREVVPNVRISFSFRNRPYIVYNKTVFIYMWRIFRWLRICVSRPYVQVDNSDDEEDMFVIDEKEFDEKEFDDI